MYDINVLRKNGVDVDKSIDLFGNVEAYNEILKDFVNEIDEKINYFTSLLKSLQINTYMLEIQSLKSDARYLGFLTLAKCAFEIEEACVKDDIEFVKTNHPKLVELLKRCLGVSRLYFGEKPYQEIDDNINPVQDNTLPVLEASIETTPVQVNIVTETISSSDVPVINEEPEEPVIISSTEVQENSPIIKINLSNNPDNIPVVRPKLMKERILIVDDSNLVTKFVSRLLSSDYDVIVAKNGKEALALLDSAEFRKNLILCLLDLNMPEMDGYAMLEKCKEKDYFKDIPFAVESGVEDTVNLDRVNSYPIVGILLKPFKEADLRRIVEKSNSTYF